MLAWVEPEFDLRRGARRARGGAGAKGEEGDGVLGREAEGGGGEVTTDKVCTRQGGDIPQQVCTAEDGGELEGGGVDLVVES